MLYIKKGDFVMAMQFERLFTPIQIGPKTARNRIMFPCHGTRFQFFNDEAEGNQYLEYQRARAKGGCGTIVIGTVHIHPQSVGFSEVVPPTPEILAPKLRKMADAVHEHGTLLLMQLYFRGASWNSVESIRSLWGFSAVPTRRTPHEFCHEMTPDEIEGVLDGYVNFAKLAKESGLDGVELHAAHCAILYQSYNEYYNKRSDKWGGQFAFITECMNRVRSAVGDDFIVGMRMPSDDFEPGGMDNDAMKKVAQAVESVGKIDYLSISEGSESEHYAYIIGTMYLSPAPWVPLTSGIKQVVRSVPVIANSRINEPTLCESILTDGHADMIAMCRALIADPEFGNKAREGRVDDIRLCIACNQGCADRFFARMHLTCLQNAAVSSEYLVGDIQLAPKKKKGVVIGGGPGGMEAARVAALRGHDVTLYEKDNQLGGQVNTLVKAPGRDEFGQATRYLTTQMDKLGVKVKLGVEATVDTVKQENPDTVIVATGSTPYIAPLQGSDQDNVVTPSQVLNDEVSVGERVVIFDNTGFQEATTVADFLADRGKKVEIVTPYHFVGIWVGYTHWPVIWPRLLKKGVVFTVNTALKNISGRSATVANVYTQEERSIDVDTVVMVTGYLPNNGLHQSLLGQVGELYVVGDSNAPRRAMDAIHDAFNVAIKI